MRHAAEILTEYLDDHDPALLIEYGDRLGNRAVFKRLGYMAEALGQDRGGLIAACGDRLSAGISPLDPGGPDGGRRDPRWRLQINVHIVREEPS
jgi:predicted transcriptional regulator of viral defense system